MAVTDLDLDALLDALAARAAERAGAAPLVNMAGDVVTPYASTGRLIVNPGDAIASAWGNTTFDQTVQAYDTAAARDSQWPTPKDGAAAYTVDTATLWLRRAGAWVPVGSSGMAPVTSGTATATDVSGEVWIAKAGVNGGAWKKARDVLHARWYRTAAWTTPTTLGGLALDTADFDAYSLYSTGSAGFVAPVAGIYRVQGQAIATIASVGQYVQIALERNAVIYAQPTVYPAAAAAAVANAGDSILSAAGDVLSLNVRGPAALTGQPGRSATYLAVDYLGTG